MNVYELLAYTQRLLADKSSRVWGSNAECLEHIQAAYQKVHGKFTAIDEGHAMVEKDYSWVTPDTNTYEAEYRLPRNCETVKSVALLNSSGKIVELAVPHDLIELQNREVNPFYAYYFRRGNLILRAGGSGSSGISTIRINYYRTAAELSVFQATLVSGNSITLPSAPYDGLGKMLAYDEAYEGDQFEVVSGAGVGELYDITAYAGSTRIATVHSAITVSANTSSVISVVPTIPVRAHPIIAYMTAMDGARIEENRRAYQLLADEVGVLWNNIEGTLSLRQVQAARAVQSSYD